MAANPEDFVSLASAVSGELYEREDEIHSLILGLTGKLNMFMYGETGVAKSKVVSRTFQRIGGLERGDYFYRNLSKFTKDTNIFGGPHLGKMQTIQHEGEIIREGVYTRNTDGKLPEASIIMLDEVWNASDALVNALLLATNEGLFEDEEYGLVSIPAIMFAAASNSIPEDSERAAIWDRFDIRLVTESIHERANQRAMLEDAAVGRLEVDPEPVVHIDDIRAANELVPKVHIPSPVFDAMMQIRHELGLKSIKASDRKWSRCVRVIQAEAWLSGAEEATLEHLSPLRHMLWRRMADLDVVASVVLSIASASEAMAYKVISDLRRLQPRIDKLAALDENEVQASASEVWTSITKAYEKSSSIRGVVTSGVGSDKLNTLVTKINELHRECMSGLQKNGFRL